MNCKKCNAPLLDGAGFCQNCGAPVEPEAKVTQPMQQPPVPQPTVEHIPAQQPPVPQPTVEHIPAQQPPAGQPMYNQTMPQQGYVPVMTPPAPQKKKSKAWIAIPIAAAVILLVVIIAAVAGKSSPEEKFVGEWSATIDYTQYLLDDVANDETTADVAAYADNSLLDATFDYTFVFEEDGTCYAELSQESYDEFMDSYMEYLKSALINYFKAEYSQYAAYYTDAEILELSDFASLEAELRADPEFAKEAIDDFDEIVRFTADKETVTFYEEYGDTTEYYVADYTAVSDDLISISFNEVDDENMFDLFQNITLEKIG